MFWREHPRSNRLLNTVASLSIGHQQRGNMGRLLALVSMLPEIIGLLI